MKVHDTISAHFGRRSAATQSAQSEKCVATFAKMWATDFIRAPVSTPSRDIDLLRVGLAQLLLSTAYTVLQLSISRTEVVIVIVVVIVLCSL